MARHLYDITLIVTRGSMSRFIILYGLISQVLVDGKLTAITFDAASAWRSHALDTPCRVRRYCSHAMMLDFKHDIYDDDACQLYYDAVYFTGRQPLQRGDGRRLI